MYRLIFDYFYVTFYNIYNNKNLIIHLMKNIKTELFIKKIELRI